MTRTQTVRLALAAMAVAAMTNRPSAGVTDSFMNIPGRPGSWQGESYKNWIRITGRYWVNGSIRMTTTLGVGDPVVAGPPAPMPGTSSKLAIALDKKNPDLPLLMRLCTSNTSIPELSFVERRTNGGNYAPKMVPGFPTYWEYKLKGVKFTDCDVNVLEAAEQALVVAFQDIEWLNYDAKGPQTVRLKSTAADIPDVKPAPESAKTRSFLITWFGWATLGDDDTCPQMNAKTPQEEYYWLLPKEEAVAERNQRGEGEVSFGNSNNRPFMDARGPHRLNVCEMPGIVRDPGNFEPRTHVALGVNLDGDDGSGPPPAGTCKHTNFTSLDGKLKGVDNQLYRVYGCIPGYRGKKGYMNQTHNARRADGNVVTLIQISGIDDLKNDDHVDLGIFYASDKPMRAASGAFIPKYSFRMTDDPNFAKYNQRISAKIADGYIVTPSIKLWRFNNGQGGIVEFNDAQFRLHIEPDGSLKGVVGGYIDWHEMAAGGSSYGEGLFNFTCPGTYASFKRNADGLKDPITGECNGISMAYEIDGVPAFITPMAPKETKITPVTVRTGQPNVR
jgi:hypothetical protein